MGSIFWGGGIKGAANLAANKRDRNFPTKNIAPPKKGLRYGFWIGFYFSRGPPPKKTHVVTRKSKPQRLYAIKVGDFLFTSCWFCRL